MSIDERERPVIKGEDAKRFLENERENDKKRKEKVKEYFKFVNEKIDSMSDEELNKLLIEVGIENCQFIEE
jgi:hypothetical protein